MKKKIALFLLTAFVASFIFGCGGSKQPVDSQETGATYETVKIGVTAGPHETIMNKVKEIAETQGLDKEGLKIEVIVFNDFIQPNTQLDQGALTMNAMQHAPFLENAIAEKGLKLSNIGSNILIPMCILSDKFDTLDAIPDGAVVGIPNDTTNLARALQLLASAGLIELPADADAMITTADIVANPHNLQFQEQEAGMLLRALPDFDFAVVNSNYVVEAGMTPSEEALFVEPTENNPWVNIFACQTGNEENPSIKKVIELYQTDEVKAFIAETYPGDAVLAAW